MVKRRLIILFVVVLGGILIWQFPTLLRAIPSRYVAAYLPQPVQALAAREHVDSLPTAEFQPDAVSLLVPEAPQDENEPATTTGDQLDLAEDTGSSLIGTDTDDARDSQLSPDRPATPTPLPTIESTSTPTQTPIPIPSSSRLGPFRHHFQTWNNCGPATLAMGLSYFDVFMSQEDTAAVLKPNPEDRNVSPSEMAAFVTKETDLLALDRANGNINKLRLLIANGIPVIIELGLDPPGEYRWMGWYGHYLLVVAYDDVEGHVWVYDSWFGTSEVPGENANPEGRQISYAELDRYWRQFNRNYVVIYRPQQAAKVTEIIGPEMDDTTMWNQALIAAQNELAAEPENAFLWFNLGTIYNALEMQDKAALAFDQARAIGLPWRMLWYQFGPFEAYYAVGRYEDVALLAEVTLQDRPYFEEAFYFKGLAQLALGNIQEARKNLEKATRFNPNFTLAEEALNQLNT